MFLFEVLLATHLFLVKIILLLVHFVAGAAESALEHDDIHSIRLLHHVDIVIPLHLC